MIRSVDYQVYQRLTEAVRKADEAIRQAMMIKTQAVANPQIMFENGVGERVNLVA